MTEPHEGTVTSQRLRTVWEELGTLDPMWAVLTYRGKDHNRWDPEEFFRSGEWDVTRMLELVDRQGLVLRHGSALDVGCGLGRLSRQLATRFERVVGVDLAESMVRGARRWNEHLRNVTFLHDASMELESVAGERFDFVVCWLVIQHNPPPLNTLLLQALLDRVAPGGVAFFQIPSVLRVLQDPAVMTNAAVTQPDYLIMAEHIAEQWVAGQRTALRVWIRNQGAQAWPHAGNNPVKLGARFFRDTSPEPVEAGRAWLTADVRPGETVRTSVTITAPEAPGDYLLRLDLVQEFVHWFADAAGTPGEVRVPVRVRPEGRTTGPAATGAEIDLSSGIEMHGLTVDDVVAHVEARGLRCVAVFPDNSAGEDRFSYKYVVTRPSPDDRQDPPRPASDTTGE